MVLFLFVGLLDRLGLSAGAGSHGCECHSGKVLKNTRGSGFSGGDCVDI